MSTKVYGLSRDIPEERYVLYADVLGFRKFVNNPTVWPNLKNYFLELTQMSSPGSITELKIAGYHPKPTMSIFSDSLMVSFPTTAEIKARHPDITAKYNDALGLGGLIWYGQLLQIYCLNHLGLPLRGAITIDKCAHSAGEVEAIYGPAITKAVQLEENCSFYPRIILDPDALSLEIEIINHPCLKLSTDKFWYIDQFYTIQVGGD